MPDEFEQQYFGSPTAGDPAADNDGDGTNNLSEYRAGTDPIMRRVFSGFFPPPGTRRASLRSPSRASTECCIAPNTPARSAPPRSGRYYKQTFRARERTFQSLTTAPPACRCDFTASSCCRNSEAGTDPVARIGPSLALISVLANPQLELYTAAGNRQLAEVGVLDGEGLRRDAIHAKHHRCRAETPHGAAVTFTRIKRAGSGDCRYVIDWYLNERGLWEPLLERSGGY